METVFWFGVSYIAVAVAAAGTAFFVVRNNPRFLNVDKMLKKVRDDKKVELKKKLQEAIDKI